MCIIYISLLHCRNTNLNGKHAECSITELLLVYTHAVERFYCIYIYIYIIQVYIVNTIIIMYFIGKLEKLICEKKTVSIEVFSSTYVQIIFLEEGMVVKSIVPVKHNPTAPFKSKGSKMGPFYIHCQCWQPQ